MVRIAVSLAVVLILAGIAIAIARADCNLQQQKKPAVPWSLCTEEEGQGSPRHEVFLNHLDGRRIAFVGDCLLRYTSPTVHSPTYVCYVSNTTCPVTLTSRGLRCHITDVFPSCYVLTVSACSHVAPNQLYLNGECTSGTVLIERRSCICCRLCCGVLGRLPDVLMV